MTKKILKINSKKLPIIGLIALIIYLLIRTLFTHIVINISDSHMGTVFWKSDKSPEKNDFVYFNFQHELLPKNLKVLSKKIVCIGGESLKIDDQFIICQDKKYPIKRNKKTGSGKTIKQFYYDDIVPQNKAILWGSNIESFDSRYWGFIDYNKLNKMKLIW